MTREYNKLADEFANLMREAESPRERLKIALDWVTSLTEEQCEIIDKELCGGEIL